MEIKKTSIEARRLAKIWHAVKTSGMSYSKTAFHKKGGATGARLWEVLLETEYYDQKSDCHPKLFILDNKRMRANIPAKWDEDDYARIIDDFVFKRAHELGISILKNRGRIKGVSPRKKITVVEETPQPACFAEDIFNVTSDLTPAEIEETEGYVLNPETGIYEEPIIPEDSLDNYDPVTGEWKTLPGGDDEVTLLGGQDVDKEDSVTKLIMDLAPLMERAKKLGITLSISNN